MLDLSEFSDIVGHIYDCTLAPDRWPEAIGRMAAAVGARAGMIALHDFDNNRGGRFFDHGIPEEQVRRYYAHYAQINPLGPVVQRRAIGQVDTLATLFHDDTWERSSFNREWIRAQGLRDLLGMLVLRSGRRGAWLVAARDEAVEDFGPAEVGVFRLLSPHICRVLHISDVLDLRTIASDQLAETLDALTTAVFLVDAEGRVVHRNEAAERLAANGAILRVGSGRLVPPHGPSRRALTEAIGRAVRGELELPQTPYSVPLGDATAEDRMLATVLPLRHRRAGGAFRPFAAAAAVFVQDAAAARAMPGQALAALYGLTPAELRFLGTLAGAGSVVKAAAALGVSEATGRTHMSSIFAKTGTARQAELIELVMASRAPIRG